MSWKKSWLDQSAHQTALTAESFEYQIKQVATSIQKCSSPPDLSAVRQTASISNNREQQSSDKDVLSETRRNNPVNNSQSALKALNCFHSRRLNDQDFQYSQDVRLSGVSQDKIPSSRKGFSNKCKIICYMLPMV